MYRTYLTNFRIQSQTCLLDKEKVFKTLNKASQYFYVEDGQLQLLRTHTMKKGLQARGIEVVPVNKVDIKFAKDIERLLDEATEQATANFNSKVVVWNAWAAENGAEILEPR